MGPHERKRHTLRGLGHDCEVHNIAVIGPSPMTYFRLILGGESGRIRSNSHECKFDNLASPMPCKPRARAGYIEFGRGSQHSSGAILHNAFHLDGMPHNSGH